METIFADGLNFCKLFWIFVIGCFLVVVIETLWCMSVHSDKHVGCKAQAQQFAVEQRHPTADVAVILKLFNAARARRWRQANTFGQFLVRDACVTLQFRQNAQVIPVEFAHEVTLCHNYCVKVSTLSQKLRK